MINTASLKKVFDIGPAFNNNNNNASASKNDDLWGIRVEIVNPDKCEGDAKDLVENINKKLSDLVGEGATEATVEGEDGSKNSIKVSISNTNVDTRYTDINSITEMLLKNKGAFGF